MLKLLRADLSRCIINRFFIAAVVAYAVVGMMLPIEMCINNPNKLPIGAIGGASNIFSFNYRMLSIPIQGILIAISICINIGNEFRSGAIRNKLIIGHTRRNVYFSHLLTSMCAAMCFNIGYLITFLIVTLPICGTSGIDTTQILLTLICGSLMMLSYASIATFIAMSVKSKSASAIICSMLLFLAIFIIPIIVHKAYEGEYIIENIFDSAGNFLYSNKMPNPHLLSKSTREFLRLIADILPSGQSYRLGMGSSVSDAPRYWQMAVSSLGVIGVSAVSGIAIFSKRNLK
ncbi:MAG: ABC transporter permease [Clostridia bacterium]|nr:ABC transporter permease [Clostridia bacterium]